MKTLLTSATALAMACSTAAADGNHATHQADAVKSAANADIAADFDILAAHVHRDGNTLVFHMTTNGVAGANTPSAVGRLGGAPVHAYVWPTSMDPSSVGFEAESGILALAATSHPDFDDTPLFDEDGDGDRGNDGARWHSHWVVLVPSEACGESALGVRDIPDGETPNLPATWPGLPIFIDSPGYTPIFDGPEIVLQIPDVSEDSFAYDGVTSALRVNANIHSPLLCVSDVFDVASGDLSLPGSVR